MGSSSPLLSNVPYQKKRPLTPALYLAHQKFPASSDQTLPSKGGLPLYEIESMRRFAGLRLERIPDETTILNFRHLLERHGLGKKLFRQINRHLQENGLLL